LLFLFDGRWSTAGSHPAICAEPEEGLRPSNKASKGGCTHLGASRCGCTTVWLCSLCVQPSYGFLAFSRFLEPFSQPLKCFCAVRSRDNAATRGYLLRRCAPRTC